MSEFSDSVHMLGGSVERAQSSLEAVSATALILPKTGPHVTVLVRHDEVKRWSKRAELPLVVWKFAADHGLEIELYAGGTRRGHLVVDFAERARAKCTGADAWVGLAGVSPEQLRAASAPQSDIGEAPHVHASRLAALLRLSDIEWISSKDLTSAESLEDLRSRYPRATYLRKGMPARWTTRAEAETHERERREWAVQSAEIVTGAPLLSLPSPPLRRGAKPKIDPPWVVRGAGEIHLEVENHGGEARGVMIELESPLLAKNAVRVDRVSIDGQVLSGERHGPSAWRAFDAGVHWPPARNPTLPTSAVRRDLRIVLGAIDRDSALLFVRVIPGTSADGRGRLVVGRQLTVERAG